MDALTLSVAMPNYNHAKYLPQAIEGILQQTRPPDEFLILDDASTDNSVDVIQSYADQHSCIRFVKNDQNQGVIAAHERLYRMSTGDYLYSAAADDDRLPEFFETAMEMVQRYPQAGLVFGDMRMVDGQGNDLGRIAASRWNESLYASPERYLREFLEVEPAGQAATAATIFKRSAFEEVGWCRPELGSFADTLATRAVALKCGVCYVPETFCVWRRLPESHSHATSRRAHEAIDMIARAAVLMRSSEFRDRFPTDYVRRWKRRQKWQTIWNRLLGDPLADPRHRPSFPVRNFRRLTRLPYCLVLLLYRGR
ncbi:MAG: glycosyltransferase family 2 protein [Pirellulaceae bacterium]